MFKRRKTWPKLNQGEKSKGSTHESLWPSTSSIYWMSFEQHEPLDGALLSVIDHTMLDEPLSIRSLCPSIQLASVALLELFPYVIQIR